MKLATIVNSTRGNTVCQQCQIADSFWARGKGLLGRKSLGADEGILLSPGSSVHMFGMKFSIDVIFLTREDVVTDLAVGLAPGKMHLAKNGAGKPFAALEVATDTIERSGVQVGDQLARRLQD